VSRSFQKFASLRLDLLARVSQRHADKDYRERLGLGLLQCRMIGLVGSQGPMTFKALCKATEVEKSQASRLVAGLTERGIFQTTSAPADQRRVIIALSAYGKKIHEQVYRLASERNERWLRVLTEEQREVFFACMDALMQQARKLSVRVGAPKQKRPKRAVSLRARPKTLEQRPRARKVELKRRASQ
jgi:DNA-binding MarR family transcriptional regulator